jgi:hypothetical protein
VRVAVAAGLVLAAFAPPLKAVEPEPLPAGLSRDDWRQIRGALDPNYVHEAQLAGHGDLNGGRATSAPRSPSRGTRQWSELRSR